MKVCLLVCANKFTHSSSAATSLCNFKVTLEALRGEQLFVHGEGVQNTPNPICIASYRRYLSIQNSSAGSLILINSYNFLLAFC